MPIITPVEKPNAQVISVSGNSSARDKAIQLLMGENSQKQETQVANPTDIKPEETTGTNAVNTGQKDTGEATDSTKAKEEPISTQYAVLARKEKALRAKAVSQDQAFKAREAALAARESELATKSAQDLTNYISKDKLKQNAFATLQEAGVTYDELTQQALNAQSPEYQQLQAVREEMREELRQLREEQGKTKQSIEQQQTQAYQQALNQIRNEAKDLISKDPSFETIKATRSVNDVVELIERTFSEEGTLLTVEQAAEAVEEHLVEEAMKLSNIKKIQDRLSRNSMQSQSNDKTQQATGGNNMKTLTNSVGVTRQLSARERALLAFKGEKIN